MSYFNHELFTILLGTLPPTQANALSGFISTNDVSGLVQQSVDRTKPLEFPDVFFKELFRKVSDAPLGIDTAEVAVSSFLHIENHNKSTRERLALMSDFISKNGHTPLARTIDQIRAQIVKIIGVRPTMIKPNITFGATTNLKSNNNVFDRFKNPTVTADCLNYLRSVGEIRNDYKTSFWPLSSNAPSPFGFRKDDFTIVEHCVINTVLKTALTDRVIAQENVVNLAYQSGAGREIREKLLRFGLDIKTSQYHHKILAQLGSLLGDLSTGDLTSASDTVVTLLVELFLPYEWFLYLDSMRSKNAKIGDSIYPLEMFSSAGNGFTFELETLIFYSIALTASNKGIYKKAPPTISVYGDDIILPTKHFTNLKMLLKQFGFILNERKSFSSGSFRESCGGDYYQGIDMRGYNAKALPQTSVDWIRVINAVRRVCYYNYGSTWRDDWCLDLWNRLIEAIPKQHQFYGPRHYGDTCINTEDRTLYIIRRKNRWSSERIKIFGEYGGDYTNVDRAISGNQTSGYLAARLVCHESVKGHGKRFSEDITCEGWYPDTMLTSTLGIKSEPRWTAYTLNGQAPENIDELCLSLNSRNSQFLRQPRSAGAYTALLKWRKLNELLIILHKVRLSKEKYVLTAMSEFDNFFLI